MTPVCTDKYVEFRIQEYKRIRTITRTSYLPRMGEMCDKVERSLGVMKCLAAKWVAEMSGQ
jgi:hypothetical protein